MTARRDGWYLVGTTNWWPDWMGPPPDVPGWVWSRICSNIECKDGIDQHVNAPCQECNREESSR